MAGGAVDGLGEGVVGALRRDPGIESAEPITEAAEALIWLRFGSADLVVVFPDAAPFPRNFTVDLESSGCRLVGAVAAGDTGGERILDEAGVLVRVTVDDDLDSTARRILESALGDHQRALYRTGRLDAEDGGAAGARRTKVLAALASLGSSAGSTTLAASLARVLVEQGFETAVVDFDPHSAGLTNWLAPPGGKKRFHRGGEAGAGNGDLQSPHWKLVSLRTGEYLARAAVRPELRELKDRTALDLLDGLVRRFRAVVVDAGSVFRRSHTGEGSPEAHGLSRLMTQNPNLASQWILVCRADPPGLRAFLGDWPKVCSVLNDPSKSIIAVNGIPPSVPSRKLNSLRRSLVRATGCRAVIGLAHDPRVRSILWEGVVEERLTGSEFYSGVRSLVDALGWITPAASVPAAGPGFAGGLVGHFLGRWRSG